MPCPGFFPMLKMGRWDLQRSCWKPAMENPPRVNSLQRNVPEDALFLLTRAPDVTDLLTTFKCKGCLPFNQPLIIIPSQHAHSPLPHHQFQGLNLKQESNEPPMDSKMPMSHLKTQHFAHTSPKGRDPGKTEQHHAAPEHLLLTFPIGSLHQLSPS